MAIKTGKKKRAPLYWAKGWGKEAPRMAAKMLALMIAVIIGGLLFSGLQGIASKGLRMALTVLFGVLFLMLYYTDGLNKGSADAAMSRHVAKMMKEGKPFDAKEEAGCFHPMKAVCAGLLAFCIPLALAVYLALTGEAYTYTLQDLPNWLTGAYGGREDVIAPLGAYMQATGATVKDWIRVVVRLFVLIFVNLFEDPQRMTLMIDRCSPLFIALYPLAYVIGYLRGPAANSKLEAQNRKAKKAAVRKQKKSSLVSELLGENQVPHYGHKRESDKPKKKELI